jgi:hypothetical protein
MSSIISYDRRCGVKVSSDRLKRAKNGHKAESERGRRTSLLLALVQMARLWENRTNSPASSQSARWGERAITGLTTQAGEDDEEGATPGALVKEWLVSSEPSCNVEVDEGLAVVAL